MPDDRFTPGAVRYEGRMPAGYAAGRALHPEAVETWRGVFSRWFAPLNPRLIADTGSGTGRFSALLAETLGARVVALEPAADMRARAQPHPSVDQLAADAQSIPLRDASVDAVWMAYVIHHIPERTACARQIARVLSPGGRLLLVGGFPDLLGDITLFRFFPETRRIVSAFPTSRQVIAELTAVGLAFETVEPVSPRTANSLAEAAARTRLRADTTLDLLSDEEFARGQAAIEAAASAEAIPKPIYDTVHLLAFSRP